MLYLIYLKIYRILSTSETTTKKTIEMENNKTKPFQILFEIENKCLWNMRFHRLRKEGEGFYKKKYGKNGALKIHR